MYPIISMRDLEQRMDEGCSMQIIDLRNRASFAKCHFKSAVNIPYSELKSRISELSRDNPLILYCSRGGQSMLVCNYLEGMGYQVVDIAGGIAIYQGKYMVWS